MTKRIRVQSVRMLGAASLVLALQACGGGNNPAMPSGNAGNDGSGSAGNTGTTGNGGTTGGGGTTGTAGTTGAGGSAPFGEPACLSSVVKGGACGPSDQQFCYKTCGPERTGVKTETCTTAGTYAEMSGCSFDPTKDYSCYKIPTAANTQCPAGVTPQGSAACDVPHCVLCNSLQGLVGGAYNDSQGSPKVGWCTCQEPNSAGMRTWTCASDTAWPCPLGAGC
jgi:hypothetical protein